MRVRTVLESIGKHSQHTKPHRKSAFSNRFYSQSRISTADAFMWTVGVHGMATYVKKQSESAEFTGRRNRRFISGKKKHDGVRVSRKPTVWKSAALRREKRKPKSDDDVITLYLQTQSAPKFGWTTFLFRFEPSTKHPGRETNSVTSHGTKTKTGQHSPPHTSLPILKSKTSRTD